MRELDINVHKKLTVNWKKTPKEMDGHTMIGRTIEQKQGYLMESLIPRERIARSTRNNSKAARQQGKERIRMIDRITVPMTRMADLSLDSQRNQVLEKTAAETRDIAEMAPAETQGMVEAELVETLGMAEKPEEIAVEMRDMVGKLDETAAVETQDMVGSRTRQR